LFFVRFRKRCLPRLEEVLAAVWVIGEVLVSRRGAWISESCLNLAETLESGEVLGSRRAEVLGFRRCAWI
jgi:hypothetical protein